MCRTICLPTRNWWPFRGLRYQADFLSAAEEAELLSVIRSLPLQPAKYKGYQARLQVISFGGSYDFDTNTLQPGKVLDERLMQLRDRVAAWLEMSPNKLVHALVAEYCRGRHWAGIATCRTLR